MQAEKSNNQVQNRPLPINQTQLAQLTKDQLVQLCALKSNKYQQFLNLLDCKNKWSSIIGFQDWTKIKLLRLDKCNIVGSNLDAFSRLKWPQLQWMKLDDNDLGVKGIKSLSKAQFPKLQTLYLSNCNLSDEAIKTLSKMKFPVLKTLSLRLDALQKIVTIDLNHIKSLSVPVCGGQKRRKLYFDLTFISGENLKRGLINLPKAQDEDKKIWRVQIDDLDIMDEVYE